MDGELLDVIKRVVNSQSKLEVLYYFHRNPYTWESLAGLAQRLHRAPGDLEGAVRELVQGEVVLARAGRGIGNDLVYNYSREVAEAPQIERLMLAYEGNERREVLQAILGHDSQARLQSMARRREVDDLRTRFVSMVTHELRTPVTVLKGMLATLRTADQLDEMQRCWLIERAESQCDRLSSLVENLLVLSGLQTGRNLELYLADVELPRLFQEMRDRCAPQAPEHTLDFQLPEAPQTIMADEYLLGQLLEELIQNAIKFSPGGSVITITVTQEGEEVVFGVEDPGVGLSELQKARAFEPFYQAELDASRLAGGLGIGLYMARNIAAAHGGRIWFEAKRPPGSLVKCALPLAGPAPA